MAARTRTVARCSACGNQESQWVGRCSGCGAWGTVQEHQQDTRDGSRADVPAARPAAPVGDVPLEAVSRHRSAIGEFDRVLGGGLVPGAVVLLGGAPGVGKSTLLLQAADALAAAGRTVLYISAEESAAQVRLRAERLGTLSRALLVAAETSLPAITALVASHEPAVVVLDSIQTVSDPRRDAPPGALVQVRDCSAALVRCARRSGAAVVLVGHVTKEGDLAGPRSLEHLVDAVLHVEGDRDQSLRMLRAVKNRFGAVGEVGCFEMTGEGMAEVADPSRLLLGGHERMAPGIAVTITVEGPRPMAVEVQALTASTALHAPRRQTSGLDRARLPQLVAVLERRAGVSLQGHDLYTSAVGGVRLREPAADLAVCLAVASARLDQRVTPGVVAVGEVGLAGEIRRVPDLDRRLAEAARLGFSAAIVPASHQGAGHGLRLHRVGSLGPALHAGLQGGRQAAARIA